VATFIIDFPFLLIPEVINKPIATDFTPIIFCQQKSILLCMIFKLLFTPF